MNRVPSPTRELGQCLIAYETHRGEPTGAGGEVILRVLETLRPRLATYLGNVGYQALLSRSLALGGVEVPWLRTVHAKADGSLEGFEKIAARVDLEEIAEGNVVLVAQLLDLLVAFIGEDLTLRIVRETWVSLSPDDFQLDPGQTK